MLRIEVKFFRGALLLLKLLLSTKLISNLASRLWNITSIISNSGPDFLCYVLLTFIFLPVFDTLIDQSVCVLEECLINSITAT